MQISSRWADCDAYGHVNNAMYYNWFDTALTTLAIEHGILRAPNQASIGPCIERLRVFATDYLPPDR